MILEAQGGIGIGEGAPLPGLSLDGEKDWERLAAWLEAHSEEVDTPSDAYAWAASLADVPGWAGPRPYCTGWSRRRCRS